MLQHIEKAKEMGVNNDWKTILLDYYLSTSSFSGALSVLNSYLSSHHSSSLPPSLFFQVLIQLGQTKDHFLALIDVKDKLCEDGMETSYDVERMIVEFLFKYGEVERGMEKVEGFRKKNEPLSNKIYHYLIENHLQKNEEEKARGLLDEMKENGLDFHSRLCSTLIDYYTQTANKEELKKWLDERKKRGKDFSILRYYTLINTAIERNDFKMAEIVINDMETTTIVPDDLLLAKIIKTFAKLGKEEESVKWAEKTKEKHGSISIFTLNALIDAAADKGDEEGMKFWMNEMKEMEINPNVATYDSLFRGTLNSGGDTQYWEDNLARQGLYRSPYNYAILLRAALKVRNMEKVKKLLQDAKEGNISFLLIINSLNGMEYNHNHKFQITDYHFGLVKEVMEAFKEVGVDPGLPVFVRLINELSNIENLKWLLERAKESGHRPEMMDYIRWVGKARKEKDVEREGLFLEHVKVKLRDPKEASLIVKEANKKKDAKVVLTLLEAFKHAGIKVDMVFYNNLLLAATKKRDRGQVELLLKEMEKEGVKKDVVTYVTLITGAQERGETEKVEGYLKEMKEEGLEPNVLVFSTLIRGAINKGNVEEAIKRIEEMKQVGELETREVEELTKDAIARSLTEVVPVLLEMIKEGGRVNEETYTKLIACHLGKREEKGLKYFEEMKREGVNPTGVTFNAVMNWALEKGDKEKMKEYMEMMEGEGIEVTMASTFIPLIDEAIRRKDREGVAYLLEEIEKKGLKRDIGVYNHIITKTLEMGDMIGAKESMDKMKKEGIEPDIITCNAIVRVAAKRGDEGGITKALKMMRASQVKPTAETFAVIKEELENRKEGGKYRVLVRRLVKDGAADRELA